MNPPFLYTPQGVGGIKSLMRKLFFLKTCGESLLYRGRAKPHRHSPFNNNVCKEYKMKTIRQGLIKWSSLIKNTIKGILLTLVLVLSSIGMYIGELSDIAFCIWCLTLVQLIEFIEEI